MIVKTKLDNLNYLSDRLQEEAVKALHGCNGSTDRMLELFSEYDTELSLAGSELNRWHSIYVAQQVAKGIDI